MRGALAMTGGGVAAIDGIAFESLPGVG